MVLTEVGPLLLDAPRCPAASFEPRGANWPRPHAPHHGHAPVHGTISKITDAIAERASVWLQQSPGAVYPIVGPDNALKGG